MSKLDNGSGNVPLERQVRREPFELPVTRYRDNENLVTCAANFETHDVCVFWSCRKFGQLEYCRFTGETIPTVAFYDALYILKMCEDALQAVLELDLPEDIKEMVNRALLYSSR